MSFLHKAEQEKVQKMVSQYQKIGEAEVGVQTDFLIKCKDVAIQKNEENPKCPCHDVLLDKVTSLEKEVEQLVSVIKHSANQPRHKISTDMFSCADQTTCSFDSFDEQSTLTQTISEVASICSNTLPGMIETTEEETAVLRTASVLVCHHHPYHHLSIMSYSRKAHQFRIMRKISCSLFLTKKNSRTVTVLEHIRSYWKVTHAWT